MADDNFSVWLAKPTWWPRLVREGRWVTGPEYVEGDAARKIAGPYGEPAEAADVAEKLLKQFGREGQSYAELRFNGDKEPHTVIFLMEDEIFGVWNTESSRWPLFYPSAGYGTMLEGWPEGFESEIDADEEGDESGFGDEDEDSDVMDLSGGMDEDEDMDDDEDEDEGEIDEVDEDYEDESDTADDLEEDEDSDEESEIDSDDDQGDDDEDENEDEEEDSEGDEGDDESDNQDGDEEDEMPRLNIFSKMKGPKGWRKRADAEELNIRNVFGFKVGVLDPDEDKTPAKREQELVTHIEFIEDDDRRSGGILRVKLPTVGDVREIEWEKKGGFYEAFIPYKAEDNDR